jgi:hypothetical protein
MDPVKILKRAWHIVWNYRVLWIFGFILALAASGSSGGNGNNGIQYNMDSSDFPAQGEEFNFDAESFGEAMNQIGEAFERAFVQEGIPPSEFTTMLWVAGFFILAMIILGVLTSIAGYVSETSVIRMVDEYESSGTKLSFREGWRLGWNRRSWKLFLIDIIVHLPVFLLLAFFVVIGFAIYNMATAPGVDGMWAGFAGVIAVVLVVLFVFAILMAFLRLLRQFFWRKAALEELSVRDSLRAGYQLFRDNWKDVGIMWLVMIGLGIAWAIVSIIAIVVSLPLIAITVVAGAIVAAIPGLLLYGFFSLFLSGYLPWVAAGLFILPLFFIVGFSPWVMLSGWALTYTSTVWTLVYRELQALPELAVGPDSEIEVLEE